ncbi:MAG: M1 family metallopeptidase [Promethearchaeota archaeon]
MLDLTFITPINYKIQFDFDVNSSDFLGITEVELKLEKVSEKIKLHASDLLISKVQFRKSYSDELSDCQYKLDSEAQELNIFLSEKIDGIIYLRIEYKGKFHHDLLGVYRSSYELDGRKYYIIATQFEEIYARRAFPCIDHPSKKATFEVEFIIDENLCGISNTLPKEEIKLENNKKRIIFEKTPIMCTYLLFFSVGKFEIIEHKSKRHLVRLITTPGKSKYGELSIDMALKSLEFLEEYTSIKYPLSKCDLIGLPDFSFGAMENWGVIAFRENLLLIYPDKTSKYGIFLVGSVVAHEVAHFWFGNLVSPLDWKYIWLNESFASYFNYAIPDYFFPEWQSWEHFIVQYYMSSLQRDGLINTSPVELLSDEEIFITPANVDIIYNKGAAVLRMLVGYLGQEKFKEGVKYFLKKFQYKNANSNDYWSALEIATREPVKDFADSWIHQPGYPILNVEENNNILKIKQERFTYLNEPSNLNWLIPLNIEIFLKSDKSEKKLLFIKEREFSIKLPDNWRAIKLNKEQMGFYRIKYNQFLLENLGPLIKDKKLSPIDRYGIENDLFALVKRGDYEINRYLIFIKKYYENENDYLPLLSLLSNLLYSQTLLDKKREEINEIGLIICENFFKQYGIEPRNEDSMTISSLRNIILWAAYRFGSKMAAEFGKKMFNELLKGNKISPDIYAGVLKIAANEDPGAMDYFKKKLSSPETPEVEKVDIYQAMGSFNNKEQLNNVLNYMLEKIPHQNWFTLFYRIGGNSAFIDSIWPWFREHFEKIKEKSPFTLGRAIASLVPMGGISHEPDIKKFFEAYKERDKFQKETIEMSLERLDININFIKMNNT